MNYKAWITVLAVAASAFGATAAPAIITISAAAHPASAIVTGGEGNWGTPSTTST